MELVVSEEIRSAEWRKSSLSGDNGNCVEAAPLSGGRVALRDSKDQDGPVLVFSRSEWVAFTGGVRSSEFDF
ncbi:DUF397 domain-containing protein [Nonomuraea sp. NPDC048916]|uniref:DUF397 domain-containing protein n=1 Tax=Nonomuraea sp. NPDC048916 TaxID=3154232 RepID=UPI0033F77F66